MYFNRIINVLINRRYFKKEIKGNKKRFIEYKWNKWLRNIKVYIKNK